MISDFDFSFIFTYSFVYLFINLLLYYYYIFKLIFIDKLEPYIMKPRAQARRLRQQIAVQGHAEEPN